MFKLVCLLKLRSFYGERNFARANVLRPRSTFVPNVSDHAIQTFEKVVLRDISLLEKRHSRTFYNLTQQGRQVLSNLLKNKEVIIKPADKGGGLVVLDKKDYVSEVCRQVGDENFYHQLWADPTSRYYNILKVILQEGLALDYIDTNLMNFLLSEHPRTPVFYVLPKIHNPGFPPVGRPNVAAQGSLHEPVSKYIDFFLQPFVRKTRSFLQDMTDFIKKS